jgi:hypothetical protein
MAQEVMHGIHDVFPPSGKNGQDPSLEKKLKKGEGTFADKMCILSFNVDGTNKTIWLEQGSRGALLTILHQWIWGAKTCRWGIPFAEFESITAKIRHAFPSATGGEGTHEPVQLGHAQIPTGNISPPKLGTQRGNMQHPSHAAKLFQQPHSLQRFSGQLARLHRNCGCIKS